MFTETTIRPREPRRNYLAAALLVSAAFSFNLMVFAPLDSYLSNAAEFWFGLNDILPVVGLAFLAVFAAGFLLCYLLPGRLRLVALAVTFSATLAMYIQGSFLMGGYPLLDGEPIDWGGMKTTAVYNTLIWLIVFALPMVLAFAREKMFKTFASAVSGIIIGIGVLTLTFSLVTTPWPTGNNVYLSTEGQFNIPKKGAVVTVLSDTFESGYLERALKEYPELKDDLAGFIFYPDTAGISTLTYLSMATLMTGEVFPLGKDMKSGMADCFQKTGFYSRMREYGYDVRYYTENNFMDESYTGDIANLVADSSSASPASVKMVSKYLYKYTLFRDMPHLLKKYFLVDNAAFDFAQRLSDSPIYLVDDDVFYDTLKKDGVTAAGGSEYILYHLNGMHAPNTHDKDFQKVTYKDDVPYAERRYQESLGQLTLFKEFIARLKAAGCYDDTTLIFTADHGHQNRFNPVFMIKPAGETAPFRINNAPISLVTDYLPLIEDLAAGQGLESEFFAIPDNQPRDRYVYNYTTRGGYGKTAVSRSKIKVDGHAGDKDAYVVWQDEYFDNSGALPVIKPGDPIPLTEDSAYALVLGFSAKSAPFSRTATVTCDFGSVPEQMDAKLAVQRVFGSSQRLKIEANGCTLYDAAVAESAVYVTFKIGRSAFKDGKLTLAFTFPDAVKNNDDTEILERVRFDSFVFGDLILK
ncbi:MAG: LTA synthase family protein [Oscillospiraceae bacterium]|nr:LTA synthase family protein [Oscillospiraceae bacterium]